MFKLRRFMKEYKLQLVLGPLAKFLEAVIDLLLPLVMAALIDKGISSNDSGLIIRYSAIMGAMVIVALASSIFCQYSASVAGMGFGKNIRVGLMKKAGTLSSRQLDRLGTQSLTNRLTTDVTQVEVGLAMLIRLMLRSPFLIAGGIVMALIMDAGLSSVLLVIAPLFILIIIFVRRKSMPYVRQAQKKTDSLSSEIKQTLGGIKEVRAYNVQEERNAAFSKANKEWKRASVRSNIFTLLLSPATTLITNAGILVIFWLVSMRTGVYPPGKLIAFIGYITQITLSMTVLANLYIVVLRAGASASRINQVFDMPDERTGGKITELIPGAKLLDIEDLEYSFAGETRCALSGISLSLSAGEVIGVIGGTGSGKSTLCDIISRQRICTAGSIRIGGVDVQELESGFLSRTVAVVPQRTVLFRGTVGENIAMGGSFSSDEIRSALEDAQIARYIDKAGGQNAPVAEGGSNFSGGQKQRLTIARAFVRRPKLLLFDDSASALDAVTNKRVIKAAAAQNAAAIVFSQRVSDVMAFKRIYVLDGGRIIASGSHKMLKRDCPLYREIILSQTGGELDV